MVSEERICGLSRETPCGARCVDGGCILDCYSRIATCEYAIVPAKKKGLRPQGEPCVVCTCEACMRYSIVTSYNYCPVCGRKYE